MTSREVRSRSGEEPVPDFQRKAERVKWVEIRTGSGWVLHGRFASPRRFAAVATFEGREIRLEIEISEPGRIESCRAVESNGAELIRSRDVGVLAEPLRALFQEAAGRAASFVERDAGPGCGPMLEPRRASVRCRHVDSRKNAVSVNRAFQAARLIREAEQEGSGLAWRYNVGDELGVGKTAAYKLRDAADELGFLA